MQQVGARAPVLKASDRIVTGVRDGIYDGNILEHASHESALS
jgi:hypothetical protein